MRRSFVLSVFIFVAVLAGNANADTVYIYAASSTADAISEIIAAYDPGYGNEVVAVYAATSTLARQIQAGAPADIILFANEDWADHLEAEALLDVASRTDLLTNRIVLVSPRLMAFEFTLDGETSLGDALGDRRFAIADPEGVPAGIYGREALIQTAQWDSLEGKLVFADSARSVLTWVARAEVAAGIVYESDALTNFSISVEVVFPPESHSPIRYPLALTAASVDRPSAIAFYNHLRGRRAADQFSAYGFGLAAGE